MNRPDHDPCAELLPAATWSQRAAVLLLAVAIVAAAAACSALWPWGFALPLP